MFGMLRRTVTPLLLLAFLFFISCNSTKQTPVKTETFQVNSFRVPCTGVGPMECLQVQKEGSDQWEFFYSEIEGFAYEPGYRYRIRVQETQLDPSQVPADASSIKYTLVSVLEKSPDPRLRLNDIWMLHELEGREVAEEDLTARMQRPYIEFHIRENRFMGKDGCNTFRGPIVSAGEKELRLGPAMGTKMSCGDMGLPGTFLGLLARVDAYRADAGTLTLLQGNTELLTFRKTD